MEYNVQTLVSSSSEWKNNVLLINEKDFQIKNDFSNEINTDKEEGNEIKTFPLSNASLIDNNNCDIANIDSIFVGASSYNINIKPQNKEDKNKIYNSFREIINNNLSYDNEKNKSNDDIDKTFEYVTKKLSLCQKLLLEINKITNNFDKTDENNKNKFEEIKTNVEKMKTQLDLAIINFYKYHNLISKNQKVDYSFEEEKISSLVYGDNIMSNFDILHLNKYHQNDLNKLGKINENDNDSSDYEDAISNHNYSSDLNNNKKNDNKLINIINDKNNNNKINFINDNIYSNENKKNNNIINNKNIFNKKENDFYDKNYDVNKIRKNLLKPLTFPPNMVKEMVTSFTQKKKSLPVYFNEPLSLGQKQCEKFFYLHLLNKAANEEKKERQLCFISAFIIGEIFLNIGRTLKPFNSIIGETYEYYNNNLSFRFYSEQVSHKPPINAYVGETPDFMMYGDTLGETSFKFFKGGMELSFKNKVHIILKKTGDHYTYIPPNAMAKGLMKPPLYMDYYGDVLIQNINNPEYKCELKFIEEGWTPNSLGQFEGTVYNNDKIIYLLGGNWKNNIYMTDPDGNNKEVLLTLDENLSYLKNTSECYYLPEFTCDLNNLTEELKESLPLNDSRFKKDMRLLEEGNIEGAQTYKEKYEEKQRKELNNDKHKILFFKEEYDSEKEINYYVPNNQYWEMKKNNTLKDNCNSKIFDISNY